MIIRVPGRRFLAWLGNVVSPVVHGSMPLLLAIISDDDANIDSYY
jgi:hypothetical protein